MKPDTISLNGSDWQFKEFIGMDWVWRNSHKPGSNDVRGWMRGTVPGSVVYDLWQNGQVPSPYFEQNTKLIEWASARTWLYKKTFFVEEALRDQRVELRFQGVDYEAQFFLNGELLGNHRGMFTPAIFAVSDRLNFGADNLLAVVIEPAPPEQPQVGRTSLVQTHKSRMTYWWDFCPRLVHQGIWDGVSLHVAGPVRLVDVFVRPQLNASYDQANVQVAVEWDGSGETAVSLQTIIRYQGQKIAQQQIETTEKRTTLTLPLANPHLWWPNGAGNQPLYQAEVRLLMNNVLSDSKQITFGVRHIEFVPNDTERDALPYTLRVNGRKLYINGWNWVPIDLLYGVERPHKLAHLLNLAQQAHVNMLRVWGGGLIEKEAFYKLCDQLGILVWQEFIQSSSGIDNNPSTDPEFRQMMVAEAVAIIRRKRNHPALAIWCGGNELQSGPERPLDNTHPTLAALQTAVNIHDPDRHWLPTSPTGPVFSNTMENINADPNSLHDVHGPWEYQGVVDQYTLYNRGTSLLHSEFGVEGITNLRTLNTVIAPENQQPVSLDNPLWHHLGAWWLPMQAWQDAFGDELADVKTAVHAAQFIQAAALGYAIEANRRRQYENSGSLPWQFNEPYPMAACTSAVDYYGRPKPVYYAVAQAFAPLTVTAKFARQAWGGEAEFVAEIWVSNGGERPLSARLELELAGLSGEKFAQKNEVVNCLPNVSKPLCTISLPLDEIGQNIFILNLAIRQSGDLLAQNRYLFSSASNMAPLLAAPATTLDVTQEGPKLKICNTGSVAAISVWLEDGRSLDQPGYITFDKNYFHLLPGETLTVEPGWADTGYSGGAIEVAALNAPIVKTFINVKKNIYSVK